MTRIETRGAAALVLATVLTAFATGGAHAASASTHCTGMTVTDSVTSDVQDGPGSTDWTNVTDGTRSFTTSSASGCAVITFSGVAFVYSGSASDYATLHVRTLL